MMHALKTPSFFRPTSRPSSPAPAPPSHPDSGAGYERAQRPLHKLSLSTFRRPSPAPARQAPNPPATLVQDGSYLEMLSLKLSEAVSRALAQPAGPAPLTEQVGGKRPIPAGRGRALGALIASELQASRDNINLYRAAVRSLQRPLSVLVSNLSAQLMPLIGSPAFLALPSAASPALNSTQIHAFAVAAFAGEVLESFDSLGLGLDADPRGEGLKGVRDGLVSVVNRVAKPLIAAIKHDVANVIDQLERPSTTSGVKGGVGAKTLIHPSIASLQATIPLYSAVLDRCVSLPAMESSVATFFISLIWHGLVALSHRPYQDISPPASPALLPYGKKRRGSPSSTPPLTPPALRFTMKLPPSRPPSPPAPSAPVPVAADARALHDVLNRLPRPAADKEAARLACEAVEEAFIDLRSLPSFLEAVYAHKADQNWEEELDALTEEIPTLLVLPVLLNVYGAPGATSVPQILGLEEAEYRKVCLSGFGRAEECALAIGHQILSLIRPYAARIVVEWLQDELAELAEESKPRT
ncbi:hypothetical protein HGRIS_002323 [Hohenbuehelia grisea]|uniref:Uncharacterized protein n=1 Tax=Hohenbuehelia grisea TaxID=104357 RepID=A0ABR3JK64_9AGAR